MKEQTKMTELQIASKIKAGRRFYVPSVREQKMALSAAKFLGIEITTETQEDKTILIKLVAP